MHWPFSLFRNRNADVSNSDKLVSRGLEFVSRQDWQSALDCFVEACRIDPERAEAHALSGSVLRRLGHSDRALTAYDRALAIGPETAEIHYNRGTLLMQMQHYARAIHSFQSALELDSSLAQAYCRIGDASWRLGDIAGAESSYRRALSLPSKFSDPHIGLGSLYSSIGRHADAISAYDAAIACQPASAIAQAGRAFALIALNRAEDALPAFEAAIQLDPSFARAFSGRAQALTQLGALDEARASHEQAAKLDPTDAQILYNRGAFLNDRRDWSAAAECFQSAIILVPEGTDAYCNLGLCFQEMGQDDLALDVYDRALALNPNLAAAYNNRGNLFRSRHQFVKATHDYENALKIEPENADAHYNLGQLMLLQGDFDNGWPEYEWRREIEEAAPAVFAKRTASEWSGDTSIQGKNVVLHAEQGLGDTLQFCRYVALVAAAGARVTLEVQPALTVLLQKLRGVDEIVPLGHSPQNADLQCSLMSLPSAFRTTLQTIPNQIPYVYPDAARVARCRVIIGENTLRRVGLAWSGNPKQRNDYHRSLSLSRLIDYLPSGFEYYCLQKDIRVQDQEVLRRNPQIKHHESLLSTFEDTAALLDTLDFVVSVDTSIAHLSGAMGKPTWILLPFLPDWRWLLNRVDCPWYPTVKLYRQQSADFWDDVLSRVRNDLSSSLGL